MAVRGRGTLEIKESRSPFFQTTSSIIGFNPSTQTRAFDAPEVRRLKFTKKGADAKSHFPFLYNRASNQIGKGIKKSDSKISEVMGKSEDPIDIGEHYGKLPGAERNGSIAYWKARGLKPRYIEANAGDPEQDFIMDRGEEIVHIPVEKVLKVFNHNHKEENPMYTTTQNDIGYKKPTIETMVSMRRSRMQHFSNGFNNIKYRDQGLNCNLTKSKVHSQLDPHFL